MTTTITVAPSNLIANLNWRYATKAFDSSKTISLEVWNALEETLILTPSSCGLQPWKFIVVTGPETKARLRPHSWNQSQVTDCSHYVVFASLLKITESDVDKFLARTVEVRGCTLESLQSFRGMVVGEVIHGPRSKVAAEWAVRQAYIALGNFMTCAALLGIDTCPMEGIQPAQYDEILGLDALGLHTVVVGVAGYRAVTDKYAAQKKVRFAQADVIVTL